MNECGISVWQVVFNGVGALGGAAGIGAFLITLSDRRIRMRLSVQYASSLAAGGHCLACKLFNDGKDLLLDPIAVEARGVPPADLLSALNASPRQSNLGNSDSVAAACLPRNQHIASDIPFPWDIADKHRSSFFVIVRMRNGWRWDIPSTLIGDSDVVGFAIEQSWWRPFGRPHLKPIRREPTI